MTKVVATAFLVLTNFMVRVAGVIVRNGYWTGNDYVDATLGYKIVDGFYYPDEGTEHKRILESAKMLRPDQASLEAENVMRIKSLFTEYDFDYYFWERGSNPPTYTAMLEAMSLFPAFCNEQVGGVQNTDDIDMTCKRELATLFGHISYTTGARDTAD